MLTSVSVDTSLHWDCISSQVLKSVCWKRGYKSCVQWTTQRYGILCEHNYTPILKNDIIYPKNRTQSLNLASVHSPVFRFDVLFSGAAFCLQLEDKDFMYNLMK